MKKTLLSSFIVLLSSLAFSQSATITNSLTKKLTSSKNHDFIKVNIVLADQVDHIYLNQKLKEEKASADLRAKTVIRESMNLANRTQKSIITYLNGNLNKVTSYKTFWIINMMSIEAKKDVIMHLASLPEVDYIELHDHFTGKPVEIMETKASTKKSIGGIENGLAAINAPALWALGYTGKARTFYSIDTGIWKDHPAVSDNWLGNYQPLSQAWNGIDSPLPVDKNGSHGTHTTGTILGLEQATSDTIGVAFNAYFMAADPIVTNLNDIKPLPDYIDVFEFALNPDGDTNTTNDIPDAINNSWGIDEHQDTSICSGYVTQMFNAIEAAGIANVFSAGNEGSGDTTIGQPQYVSTGLVNTFTVGAVNSQTAGNPIAGFSSRGPTACPATGSIAIKPEVVAPGVNVRSCVDQNNYSNYQGTSMAGPHAVGAVLLLKEAFPNVTGEEILLALYNSAVDLGVAGEDNTYGMGMIDVLAAYNLLALTNTPTPPNQYKYDLTVSEILNPTREIRCDNNIDPKIVLKNNGDSSIVNAEIVYQLNNEPSQNFSWTGTLLANDTVHVTLPQIVAQNIGDYELKVKATFDTTKTECDYINNQRMFRFNIRDIHATLPYKEDFELMRIDSSEWLIDNADGMTTWDTTETSGLTYGYHSATMQLFDYTGSKQLDGLISTSITLPNDDSLFVRFDVAYQEIHQILADTLTVFLSTDCGNTFNQIYKKGGSVLETYTTITAPFTPSLPNHWRTDYIDVTSYANNDIILKFESYNKSGNNLYLDNIWVYEGDEPVGINETNIQDISIYPNPTNGLFNIDLGNSSQGIYSIIITDMLGKVVHNNQTNKSKTVIDLSHLNNGIYLINIQNKDSKITKKLIKQ
jgi:bacillopeptidase F